MGVSRALSPNYYLDPETFAKEREKVFYRTWQYAAHISQLEKAGDYVSFQIMDQDLFLIRDRAGDIRCFYNVCMHRAHRLVEGDGNKRMIVCPYHAWAYGLDGKLRTAMNHEKVEGFDKDSICLTEVRTEALWGFIFVNLDNEALPMDSWFPGVREEIKEFVPDIEQLRPMKVFEVEEACNWKVTVENYNECYHCRFNHQTFATGVLDGETFNILPDSHVLRHTAVAADLDKMTYPIDPDSNPRATDYGSWFLWPGVSFQVYPGNVLNTYHFVPHGIDKTIVNRGWYTVGGHESQVIEKLAQQDFDTTLSEDIRLVESVQRGLSSRGYRPGPLIIDPDTGVNSEHTIKALNDWLLEAIEA